VKLAIVVQRYGRGISGGAELHARYLAEHLARHAEIEVLTTCAVDYVTWRNELAPGVEFVNGVAVRRFPVAHERDPETFGRWSDVVFERRHAIRDELEWLDAEGPAAPALIDHLRGRASAFDHVLLFSYRYYHAFYGARAASPRAVLVPTAERDAAVGLAIFGPIFRGVRALMYNSPEERAMIQAASGNQDVPGVVVGVGSEVPPNPQPGRFRQKYGIRGPFAVYVGRIDKNKGCEELFEFFRAYMRDPSNRLSLVLIGASLLPVPPHPRICHLGFLDDADKFDAMAAADVLIMPSYYESLSMVALEAWALGRPVLVNGRCDVLKGQAIRSNAGLYYETEAEFVETLRSIEHNRWLASLLGRNGRQFYREHYDWPVIERKYLDMFERLRRERARRAMEPLPGWWARRKETCEPGERVLERLPRGPVLEPRQAEAAAPLEERAGTNTGQATPASQAAPARSPQPRRPFQGRAREGRRAGARQPDGPPR